MRERQAGCRKRPRRRTVQPCSGEGDGPSAMHFQTTQQFLRGSVRRTILVSTSGVELVECLLSWSSGASQLAGGADVSFATRRRSFWDEGILNNSHVVRGVHAEERMN